jgi:hypothetical protein
VIFARAAAFGLTAGRGPTMAVDASAFEPRAASFYYVHRARDRRRRRRGRRAARAGPERLSLRYAPHPKLTVAVHTASHLIAGALPGEGPTADFPGFAPVLRQAVALLRVSAVVADAGFDCEAAHRLCRRTLGIRRTAIRLNPRRTGRRWPQTPARRAMRRQFPWRVYRRRQQVESVFSRDKRRLGAALTARAPAHQPEELVLRVLTHNLMILLVPPSNPFNRAGLTP